MAKAHSQDKDAGDRVYSLLDQDLYKFTMQCAVLRYFPKVEVAYTLINRTQHMKFTLQAYEWIQAQTARLGGATASEDELAWLDITCPYLDKGYLSYLRDFRLRPDEHVKLDFKIDTQKKHAQTEGDLSLEVQGLWVETILYDILLLAIVSEAYFKFVDRNWSLSGQEQRAKEKALVLLKNGCIFSELGTRRRRSYDTHFAVLKGLIAGSQNAEVYENEPTGTFLGTSNMHLAMFFGLTPVGTVAHEWFMAIAALTVEYENANECALRYWTKMLEAGVTPIAVTDTFGTPNFLEAFSRKAPKGSHDVQSNSNAQRTYAEIFAGVRQDSGNPFNYIQLIASFYRRLDITENKIILFSDSLDVDKCITYRKATVAAGNLTPYFGIGTYFTNDFQQLEEMVFEISADVQEAVQASKPSVKSAPLNVVMKMTEANGKQVVKLSDHHGKHTGDGTLIEEVKRLVRYQELEWKDGDESRRWATS